MTNWGYKGFGFDTATTLQSRDYKDPQITAFVQNQRDEVRDLKGQTFLKLAYPIEGNGNRPSHQGAGINDDDTSYTLNTTEKHGVAFAVQTGHTEGNGNGFNEDDKSYTLSRANDHAVIYENHPADSRITECSDGIAPTLHSRMGTGGGNVPLVKETVSEDG